MADLLTKKSLILLVAGATLPVSTDFVETVEALIMNPKPTTEESKRLTGQLGFSETQVNIDDVTLDGQTITHKIRHIGTDFTIAPEWNNMLIVSGFSETYDATVGQESYTYINTQTPTKGSAIQYTDGKKQSFTDTIVGATTLTFENGKSGMIETALSGFYDNAGIPVNQANPSVIVNPEPLMNVRVADIFTEDGTALEVKTVKFMLEPEIKKTMAFGRKDFQITDYVCKVEVTYVLSDSDYSTAITDMQTQASKVLDIKLGTVGTGALVNGKSMHITCPIAKISDFSDSDVDGALDRTVTYTLTPDGSNEALSIKVGFFA